MKTVLITGAGRGLGLAFVQAYLRRDMQVIATARAPDRYAALTALAAQNPLLRLAAMDVADDDSIAACAAQFPDLALDLLINNAGILSGAGKHQFHEKDQDASQRFGSLDRAAWLRVFSVNSIAPAKVTEAFLPALQRGAARKVVIISSVMGRIARAEPSHFAYCSSKAATNSVMRALSESLRNEKISVISMHPGWVRTDMGGPDGRLEADESVASLCRVIDSVTLHDTGHFFDYEGNSLDW